MWTGKIELRGIKGGIISKRILKQASLIAMAYWFAFGASLSVRAQQEQALIDCMQMKPGQFETLPDEQKISCGGEEKTAGEIRRELQGKRQRNQAQEAQALEEAEAKLQELQKEFGQEIRMEEAEARMQVELAKLKQRVEDTEATRTPLEQIRHEVVRLEQQMQDASDTKEKAQIKARFKELAEQLYKMDGEGDKFKYLFTRIDRAIDLDQLSWIPHIDSLFPFSVVSPDGPIIISGSHFGTTVGGKLWLKGSFGMRKMIIDVWTDDAIGAFIPSAAAIGTIFDLNLTLQVESFQGLWSNEFPLQWVQEAKLLNTDSVSVNNCGDDANVNSCNWEANSDYCFSSSNMAEMILASKPPDPNCPCSARGFHGNCWGATGDDFGTDIYEIGPLKNAWTLHSFTFGDSLPKNDDACDDAVRPLGFQSGGDYWAPAIPWCVTPNDELVYWLKVYIVGPVGFPH